MENIIRQLKAELNTLMEADIPSGKKLRTAINHARGIATLESIVLRNIRERQKLEADVLLLQSIINSAYQHHGRVMIADLLPLASLAALRKAIALGVSRGLIETYNDSEGWILHEEVHIRGFSYPEGEMVPGSQEWHYARRQRRIAQETDH